MEAYEGRDYRMSERHAPIGPLAFQAGLASCFASLSGALCAVVYRSLTEAA